MTLTRTPRTRSSTTRRRLARRPLCAAAALAVVGGMAAVPVVGSSAQADEAGFQQTNLVSNRVGVPAQFHDPALKNAWGMSASPTSPMWVSNNNDDSTTLYTEQILGLKVTLPGNIAKVAIEGGAPTGQVFNTGDFLAHSADRKTSQKANFIFASENGTITAWAFGLDNSTAHIEVDNGANAVYKGLAIATSGANTYLYAANFRSGRVEVYNTDYKPVALTGLFTDFTLPNGYAPFNIQELGGKLYVTYAQQNDQLHDDISGPGHGFIDVFNTDGTLVGRLVSRGALDSPWGLAIAPAGFGRFGGALLVGNFGDGRINAYNATTGAHLGTLRVADEKPIMIDGLWGLRFGNGTSFKTNELVFSAGPNGEQDGLLGTITASGHSEG
jgi:uncharacterized protein (TIGR03118 family)